VLTRNLSPTPPCLQGMKQAEQKEVLTAFRASQFNVLVATCIGEEGLDIPEVRASMLSAW
jgi:ERCC4-related helicase